jgi:amidase
MIIRFCLFLTLFLQACTTASPPRDHSEVTALYTMTAMDLATEIRSGTITSEQIVRAYLERINSYDKKGPMIQSIIALNPNALIEARQLDKEAKSGAFRGPLHGIPILVKDNIETKELPTTAGSLALANNDTGRDAPIIAKLRSQGAIILGKTNLSEWANFRSKKAIAGWSGIGGQTRNPHSLDRSPCGSSAGSAAAVAAFFAPLSIGTETNGSITCPAAMNGIVGFKPTVGLLSRTHIVPISISQDSAGPMAKTVSDVAMMLSAMAGSDVDDPATQLAEQHKRDYVRGLDRGLSGMRIGVFRWAEGKNAAVSKAFNEALNVLESEGAELVDITDFSPDPVMWNSGDTYLHTEFKHALNAYLENAAPAVNTRSLSDLITFNERHAERELAIFDQSIFLTVQDAAVIDDPAHIETIRAIRHAARENGIDKLLKEYRVEVLLMPSAAPAAFTDVAYTTRSATGPIGAGWLAAMAGYPILSVPMGSYLGLPLGLMFTGTAWDDETVLAVGHAYQKAAGIDLIPTFANGPFEMTETAKIMRPNEGN